MSLNPARPLRYLTPILVLMLASGCSAIQKLGVDVSKALVEASAKLDPLAIKKLMEENHSLQDQLTALRLAVRTADSQQISIGGSLKMWVDCAPTVYPNPGSTSTFEILDKDSHLLKQVAYQPCNNARQEITLAGQQLTAGAYTLRATYNGPDINSFHFKTQLEGLLADGTLGVLSVFEHTSSVKNQMAGVKPVGNGVQVEHTHSFWVRVGGDAKLHIAN
jgi:hypothetical protein